MEKHGGGSNTALAVPLTVSAGGVGQRVGEERPLPDEAGMTPGQPGHRSTALRKSEGVQLQEGRLAAL